MNKRLNNFLRDILSFVILVALLYFAWSAKPAVEYFHSLSLSTSDYGFASLFTGTLWGSMGLLIVLVSLILIALELRAYEESPDDEFLSLMMLLWPFLGWYVGHDFNPDDKQSAYLGFSLVTGVLALYSGGTLLRMITRRTGFRRNL